MKNKKYLLIFILLLAISIMAIGYASFATSISIMGTATINGEWDVRITIIETIQTTGKANPGEPTFSNTTINFNAELYEPGDEIKYKITIANLGNINAKLDDVLFMSKETDEECPITFETSEIAKTLNVDEETSFTITIKFKDNVEQMPEITTKSITGFISYVQN